MDNDELKKVLTGARQEAAAAALEKAGERLTNQTNNISKLRMDFYDRLVLLDGGTISLSLTLVGLLQKAGRPAQWLPLLFSSWICFLASLLLGMLRNWREPDRLVAAEMASYALVVHEYFSSFVQQAESLGVSTTDSPVQSVLAQGPTLVHQQQAQQKGLDKQTKRLGGASLLFTALGYVLLLWFAIVNAAALFR